MRRPTRTELCGVTCGECRQRPNQLTKELHGASAAAREITRRGANVRSDAPRLRRRFGTPDRRQLRHPQTSQGQGLARAPSVLESVPGWPGAIAAAWNILDRYPRRVMRWLIPGVAEC